MVFESTARPGVVISRMELQSISKQRLDFGGNYKSAFNFSRYIRLRLRSNICHSLQELASVAQLLNLLISLFIVSRKPITNKLEGRKKIYTTIY